MPTKEQVYLENAELQTLLRHLDKNAAQLLHSHSDQLKATTATLVKPPGRRWP